MIALIGVSLSTLTPVPRTSIYRDSDKDRLVHQLNK